MATDSDLHAEALEAYEDAIDAADENRAGYCEDFRFARLGEQWPEEIRKARMTPGAERPMLTMNQMPAFARQVINDIRQNRPQTKIRPVDSDADIETALVMQGLIRNIEEASNAAVAYDTAAESAVYGGFGYWRIDVDYACDDSFDQDIRIKRVSNPLSVVPDPYSTEADSSDWNVAFVVDLLSEKQFKATYPDADPVSFDALDAKVRRNWTDGDDILVAEYWKREKVDKLILRLSDNSTIDAKMFEEDADVYAAAGITVIGQRTIQAHKVTQCLLNGQQVLTKREVMQGGKRVTKDRYEWPGKFIPIIPVYGDEINFEGKRLLRSMIHDAKDAQKQLNYWETTATELVALAPRVPFIGEEKAFSVDPNWATANTQNHPYLMIKDGAQIPQRQSVDSGPAVGAITQARQSRDNIKAILGMYDASLGNRKGDQSGIAIRSLQKEGDVSQFHFSDNLMRAIRHSGLVIMDLIPHVYTKDRIVRVLGEDGAAQNVQIGERMRPNEMTAGPRPGEGPASAQMQPQGAPVQPGQEPEPPRIGALQGVFDLSLGKYDLVVEAGPSYTTQRQETAAQIGQLLSSFPQAAPVIGDLLVKNFDWKDADEISRRLKKLLPPALQDGAPSPELEQAQQQIAMLTQQLQQVMGELANERMDTEQQKAKAAVDMRKLDVEEQKVRVEAARVANEARTIGVTEQGASDQSAVMNGVAQLAATMGQAAQAIAVATQGLQQAVVVAAAPKTKDVTMMKQPDGSYRAQVVEQAMVQ
jgi:hypothetical protein